MEVLEKLRNFNAAKADTDELAFMLANCRMINTEIERVTGTPSQEWKEKQDVLEKALKERYRDILMQQLTEAKARRAALRTAEEKRAAYDADIETLSKKLGITE